MATLGHEAFRIAIEQFGGCDCYFTEMINASTLLTKGPFESYYLINECAKEKLIWQLTGNKPSVIADAVPYITQFGGFGIDLNMGCSAPQIVRTGAGIFWMLRPLSETEELVRLVKNQIDEVEKNTGKHFRLSVKCRLGREDFTEESFFSFTDMLVANGVECITLHPRTQKEKYRGLPKYEYVEKLCNRYEGKISVCLNGGIFDSSTALNAISKAPSCDSLMIARAAAQKPWIFAEIKGLHQTVDCEKLAIDFIQNVQKYQPAEFVKTRLQRFFTYYCQNFSFGHYFHTQMINSPSPEESIARVKDYFEKLPDDRFISF